MSSEGAPGNAPVVLNPTPNATAEDLLRTLPADKTRYDELRDANGALRAHWRPVLGHVAALGEDEYWRAMASARRMVRDNGVTYNVYDEADGQARPWKLDILPFVISAEEWAEIERGIVQRARLSNALLADIYGPQKLIADGHLPPHLVEGHPGFLRPLVGAVPPGGVHLHLYAVDLTRGLDGKWIVQGERLDAPSGAGYALENRIIVSQTFPELFRDANVQRLASFFHAHREALMGLAQPGRSRAVFLTPGPYNESFFEHAYLARYLGLALVEGEDLVVRDGDVYLKTLHGLQRVDVIVRRIDSSFCDPVELKPDSALGVPGLVQAARAGRVVIANALGCEVAEGPALAAYLPKLCNALLGETLELQNAATIWCGTEQGRAAAIADIDRYVFRGAFDSRPLFVKGSTARLGGDLNDAGRDILRDLVKRRGATVVAHDHPHPGGAPLYDAGRLSVRPMSLRIYAVWTPAGYRVMPGGLMRVAAEESKRALTMQSGAASKDTWVLSNAPVDAFTMLSRPGEPLRIQRQGEDAPSRAMDNLYWLGRYTERAETLVRVLRAVVLRLGDNAGFEVTATAAELARRLLVPMGQASAAAADEAAAGDVTRLAAELHELVFSRKHPQGLRKTLENVQRTAWLVRDRLSLDTWRTVMSFAAAGPTAEGDEMPDPAATRAHLDALVRRSAALAGLAAENMTRGPNWLFLDFGRRVERADNLIWLMQRLVLPRTAPHDTTALQLLLEIADSSMTYRSRYLGVFQTAPVVDLLLLDESNPRGVAFQLATLAHHAANLPSADPSDCPSSRQLAEMRAGLAVVDPTALTQANDAGDMPLRALFDTLSAGLVRLSDTLSGSYFQHAALHRAGAAPTTEDR